MKDKRKYKHWTLHEIKFLKLMWPIASAGKIAIQLGRSTISVEGALRVYGIAGMKRIKPQITNQCSERKLNVR